MPHAIPDSEFRFHLSHQVVSAPDRRSRGSFLRRIVLCALAQIGRFRYDVLNWCAARRSCFLRDKLLAVSRVPFSYPIDDSVYRRLVQFVKVARRNDLEGCRFILFNQRLDHPCVIRLAVADVEKKYACGQYRIICLTRLD